MPKPHYTPQGGPYLPAWAKPSVAAPESGARTGGPKPVLSGKVRNQAAEVERPHRELSQAHQGQPGWLAAHPGKASVKMVWIALGVCAAVLDRDCRLVV